MTRNKYALYLKYASKAKLAQDIPLEEEEEGANTEKPKGSAGGGAGGVKGDVPGEWIEFYNDIGDEKVVNPLTGRKIKWKTMITYRSKDDRLKKLVDDKHDEWKKNKMEEMEREEESNFDRDKAIQDYKDHKGKEGDVEVEEGYSLRDKTEEVVGDLQNEGVDDLPDRYDIAKALEDPEKRKELREKLETHLFHKEMKKQIFEKLRDLLQIMGADERDLEDLLNDDPSLAKGMVEKGSGQDKKKGKKNKDSELGEDEDEDEDDNPLAPKKKKDISKKKSLPKTKSPLDREEEPEPEKGDNEKEVLSDKKKNVKLASKLASQFLTAKKGKGWSKLPKGWTEESFSKFYDSISKGKEDPFKACVTKLKGNMEKPEAFCAATIDKAKGTTSWRSEGRKKKTASDYYKKWLEDLD